MILDDQLKFSSAQAITAAAGSTNTIDLGAVRNIGVGEELYVVLVVTTAFTDSGSNSTLTVALEGDSTTTITPDGTQQLFVVPAVSAVGYKIFGRINPLFASNYQYVRLYYVPDGSDLTAGAVTAYITTSVDSIVNYADGLTIS